MTLTLVCESDARATSVASAVRALRRQEMPLEEIEAVIAADDPGTLRRHLELHRERLEERLAEEQREVADVERFLTEAIIERQSGRDELRSA
jgi:DNA-binding transcriptional MerR regulator